MASESGRDAARIRWLVAARFSEHPRGEFFAVAPDTLDGALAARLGRLAVRVPDRLGEGDLRTVAFEVARLRTFTLGGMAEAVPELRALKALADRPPSPGEAARVVEAAVGPGKLARACAAAAGDPAVPAPATSGAAASVDAFVKGLGLGAGGSPGAARRVRDAIEAALYGTARDVLAQEPVRRLEGTWRGLRFLLAHGSPASGLHVECLDAAPEEVAGSVRARRGEDGFDEPDAIFVAEPVRALEVLGELADLGEEVLAPCLAALAPELLGSAGAGELAERAEREEGWPEPFLALRARPSSRWLCLALNDVALLAEGAGASRRSAFGSAVWGLAALLSSSYAASGAFARAVGKAGALSAPAAVNLSEGPKKGALVPTEAFLAIPAQKALAAAGLLALGSVQDSDRLVLSAAPMLSSEAGAAPLPAQILTGRIVRFARWAKRQIDPTRPADEVGALFREAAALFLFPGLEGAAALGARVEGAPADRVLHVAARVKATHALVPLDIEFTLPLEEGPSQLGR